MTSITGISMAAMTPQENRIPILMSIERSGIRTPIRPTCTTIIDTEFTNF